MKKRILIIVFIISLIIPINYIYANTEEETIASQQEEFKIDEFITKSKEYSGEFFGGINIQDLLNSAIKGEVDNTTIIKRIINLFRSVYTYISLHTVYRRGWIRTFVKTIVFLVRRVIRLPTLRICTMIIKYNKTK